VDGIELPSNRPIEIRARAGEALLAWKDVGKLAIRAGKQIVVEANDDADAAMLRRFVVGPALAALLVQRGLLVLHASAVAVGDGAIAFLGMAGQGKSTMASAMYEHGHAVVSDDVVPVLRDGDRCVTLPGFPQLKL